MKNFIKITTFSAALFHSISSVMAVVKYEDVPTQDKEVYFALKELGGFFARTVERFLAVSDRHPDFDQYENSPYITPPATVYAQSVANLQTAFDQKLRDSSIPQGHQGTLSTAYTYHLTRFQEIFGDSFQETERLENAVRGLYTPGANETGGKPITPALCQEIFTHQANVSRLQGQYPQFFQSHNMTVFAFCMNDQDVVNNGKVEPVHLPYLDMLRQYGQQSPALDPQAFAVLSPEHPMVYNASQAIPANPSTGECSDMHREKVDITLLELVPLVNGIPPETYRAGYQPYTYTPAPEQAPAPAASAAPAQGYPAATPRAGATRSPEEQDEADLEALRRNLKDMGLTPAEIDGIIEENRAQQVAQRGTTRDDGNPEAVPAQPPVRINFDSLSPKQNGEWQKIQDATTIIEDQKSTVRLPYTRHGNEHIMNYGIDSAHFPITPTIRDNMAKLLKSILEKLHLPTDYNPDDVDLQPWLQRVSIGVYELPEYKLGNMMALFTTKLDKDLYQNFMGVLQQIRAVDQHYGQLYLDGRNTLLLTMLSCLDEHFYVENGALTTRCGIGVKGRTFLLQKALAEFLLKCNGR